MILFSLVFSNGSIHRKLQIRQKEKFETITQKINKQIAKGGVIAFGGNVLINILAFSTHIILGRYLGLVEYGLYSLLLSIINILRTAGSLGLEHSIVRFCAIFRAEKNSNKVKGVFLTALILTTSTSLLLTLVTGIFAKSLAVLFLKDSVHTPLIILFLLSIPFLSITTVSAAFSQSQKNILAQQAIQVFRPAMNLAFLGIIYFSSWGLIGASSAFILSAVISALLGLIFAIKTSSDFFPINLKSLAYPYRLIIRFSFPIFLSGFIYLLLQNIDSLMLGYLSNTVEVGLYNAAARIALFQTIVLSAFISISSPIMAELHFANKTDQLASVYQTTTRWIIMLTIPIFIILSFASDSIMTVFGREFVGGSSVLILLAFAQLFNAATGPIGKLLEMSGKQDFTLGVLSLVIILDIFLNVWLIPAFGAVGAAISTMTSIVLVFGTLTFFAQTIVGFKIHNLESLRPILIGVTTFILGLFLRNLLEQSQKSELINVTMLIIIYTTLVATIGSTESDKALIQSTIKDFATISRKKK